jgi:MYXO-CTERM domain-containing protein
MIFVTSQQQTTLYDMIKYAGSPSSFAWVLPIKGTVSVGLSSYTLFAALDQVTKPTIFAPAYPTCPTPPNCPACGGNDAGSAADGSVSGGVTVLSQATVGPYDTVQLQSSDPNALTTWLTANGYSIPTDIQPLIASYVSSGFNFLALRLSPGQGVQAMRPISVTSPGAGLSLPLRMVAAGTGAKVGITLWVVSGGRYEAQNFSNFTISPSELVWDWRINSSNYATLQQSKEAALNNAAWQTESSLSVSPVAVENLVLQTRGGFDASIDPTTEGYTSSDAGDASTADQQRQADLATLFPGGSATVRVTRMRADLSRAALANDLALTAASDQSEVSNTYQVTHAIDVPVCPNPPVCPCGTNGNAAGSSSGGGYGSSEAGTPVTGAGDDGGGTSGDTNGADGGDGTHGSAKGSGCSASAADANGTSEWAFVGLLGAAVAGSRLRRRRRS